MDQMKKNKIEIGDFFRSQQGVVVEVMEYVPAKKCPKKDLGMHVDRESWKLPSYVVQRMGNTGLFTRRTLKSDFENRLFWEKVDKACWDRAFSGAKKVKVSEAANPEVKPESEVKPQDGSYNPPVGSLHRNVKGQIFRIVEVVPAFHMAKDYDTIPCGVGVWSLTTAVMRNVDKNGDPYHLRLPIKNLSQWERLPDNYVMPSPEVQAEQKAANGGKNEFVTCTRDTGIDNIKQRGLTVGKKYEVFCKSNDSFLIVDDLGVKGWCHKGWFEEVKPAKSKSHKRVRCNKVGLTNLIENVWYDVVKETKKSYLVNDDRGKPYWYSKSMFNPPSELDSFSLDIPEKGKVMVCVNRNGIKDITEGKAYEILGAGGVGGKMDCYIVENDKGHRVQIDKNRFGEKKSIMQVRRKYDENCLNHGIWYEVKKETEKSYYLSDDRGMLRWYPKRLFEPPCQKMEVKPIDAKYKVGDEVSVGGNDPRVIIEVIPAWQKPSNRQFSMELPIGIVRYIVRGPGGWREMISESTIVSLFVPVKQKQQFSVGDIVKEVGTYNLCEIVEVVQPNTKANSFMEFHFGKLVNRVSYVLNTVYNHPVQQYPEYIFPATQEEQIEYLKKKSDWQARKIKEVIAEKQVLVSSLDRWEQWEKQEYDKNLKDAGFITAMFVTAIDTPDIKTGIIPLTPFKKYAIIEQTDVAYKVKGDDGRVVAYDKARFIEGIAQGHMFYCRDEDDEAGKLEEDRLERRNRQFIRDSMIEESNTQKQTFTLDEVVQAVIKALKGAKIS